MIGKRLAHYEILDKIGSGGMGEVYRARDTRLDRDVALKVMLAEMEHNAARSARFGREARAVAALKHGLRNARARRRHARLRLAALVGMCCLPSGSLAEDTSGALLYDLRQPLVESRAPDPLANAPKFPIGDAQLATRVLLAGDSWAQYMWDDGSHNTIFDRFGHGDARAVSLSLADNPLPGYTGPEYAVGGSQAAHWVDTVNYPWLNNLLNALVANPDIDTVVLSIGGNDMLAGRSGGGWYDDMDLDVPGSEAALLDRVTNDTATIINAVLAVRPELRVMISSYDFPNFNVGFWCFVSACPMRRNLSHTDNDLVTDAELNAMLATVEQRRIDLANTDERILYDNSLGLMHFVYGDGVVGPGILPSPGQTPPTYAPFPGGNALRPSLRSCFRWPNGLDADPIHLDLEGYQYKITGQTQAWFFPHFRGNVSTTIAALGGTASGWTDGTTFGTDALRVGDSGPASYAGILSFDTSVIPDGATVTRVAVYLHRTSATGTNPFASGALGVPRIDVATGSFGAPEVEASDANAPASATDTGVAYGSAAVNLAAIRLDITGAGLAAINTSGWTQVRVAFPSIGGGTGADYVTFYDGDAGLPAHAGLPTLADYMGTAAPFLDIEYEVPTDVPAADVASTAITRVSSWPNPFRGSTTIHFVLAKPGPVEVDLFDVAGRRVVRLVGATLPAGAQSVTWDGRNQFGERAPAGIYLARVTGATTARSVRLVLR